ncbi:NAD(P)-binding domain-containing protein [Jannaschia aquimarina]|uniref:NAD binding domain of 6-phosphogluconate dehydrogenase n=1 Tax=Jannaschia aquimarina TaxID=935700 RepID=A0A0D1EKF3_9RHOB|nr:DUF1932 domain-containing protein [Jannaschia aquimarina]KIT16250.1 NAD binding domain of 6-phosphogluconate dehydrogenase [Jannaschia aquimarina]SNT15278.1 3-hydroxyisobutyrate dehydrogenase [Jannaschia aquimarina]
MIVAFIGFSEAGPAFAEAMVGNGAEVRAFDLRSLDARQAEAQAALCARVGAAHSGSLAAALDGADLVVSTVTAGAALRVARDAAPLLAAEACYLDMNSISPDGKRAVGDAVAPNAFVEGVAMGRIAEGKLPRVLLSGPGSAIWAERLAALGWSAKSAGEAWGAAPKAKLLRSVMVKGFEALLVEAFEGARAESLEPVLLETLADWIPELDWPAFTSYHLGRVAKHGPRRAEELRECAAMLEQMGRSVTMSARAAEIMAAAGPTPAAAQPTS